MPKKKINYHEHDTDLPETTSVASANECTGLMPNSPKNDAELESFEELSPMAIPSGGCAAPKLRPPAAGHDATHTSPIISAERPATSASKNRNCRSTERK